MSKQTKIIGIDIGGTKCSIVIGQYGSVEDLQILDKISFVTKVKCGPRYILNQIEEAIEELLQRNNLQTTDILSIGVSCGGPLDSNLGIISSPPNLPGWDGVEIVKLLQDKFNIPAKLQNDANAGALAEWKFGAGKGVTNLIFLTFGTGMGSGLILNGKLYSGTNGMAGEVGHIRLENIGPVGYGKAGSFEGFCSGSGLVQLAKIKALEKLQMGEGASFCKTMDELNHITAKTIADAANDGDKLALEIYETCGAYLGKALSILIDILNPELIVIGSIFARSGDLMWPAAQKIIQAESLNLNRQVCKIVPAGLQEDVGDYAALAVALNN